MKRAVRDRVADGQGERMAGVGAALFLVIECVTCGHPIADGSQAWRCCPEHHDKYGPGEWECAECVLETHMRMAL